ncbi:MAG: NADH-quinone oxidoreductase subunit NuoG, partial [Pseudomonadota bacterium]
AREAQKGTMEFLLINHPLDCPICDQGGECELQDVAMGYGGDVSRFTERKRVVPDPDIGPLIATDMTRCIHCTRCVRFGDEVAGLRELGATGRGEHTKIGTYVAHSVTSELSGNVIDLCPVGALTSKPFRFTARAWELTQHETIAPHDSVGSNLFVHVRRNELMRVVPRENTAVNETWIADRDRFSYPGAHAEDRLLHPMIKEDDSWREAEWEEALAVVARGLKDAVAQDAAALGTLVSPKATLEELYLGQKITRGLGSNNIDHRLRTGDFRAPDTDPVVPWLGASLKDLAGLDAVLLVGSNVRKEQPLINHRLRRAALGGAAVMALNPVAYDFNYELDEGLVSAPSRMLDELAAVASAAGVDHPLVSDARAGDVHRRIADRFKASQRAMILLGNQAVAHADFTLLRGLASKLAEATGARLGFLPEAANSVGAWLAGAVPHRLPGAAPVEGGKPISPLAESQKAYLLVDFEPDQDVANPAAMAAALRGADFVVALSSFRSALLEETADVLLPLASFGETSGTFVNAQGDWQSFRGVVAPGGEARPGWKILRVLGNLLGLDGFEFTSSEEVGDELRAQCAGTLGAVSSGLNGSERHLGTVQMERIGVVAPYALDALTRRAGPLQHTADARWAIRLNPATAASAGVAEGDDVAVVQNGASFAGEAQMDTAVPEGCVWCPAGIPGSEVLGALYGEVSLEKL